MLSAGEKVKVKEAILQSIKKVEDDIKELKEATKPIAPENAIGRVSRMDAINNRSVNEAALRQSEAKLKRLEQALKTMDNPNFGQCYRCGEDIPIGRLMLMPESTKCIKCAQRG